MKNKKINISSIKEGQVLAEEVQTSLGGTLFYKGHLLQKQDLDVLQAFFIPHVFVSVEDKESIEGEVDDTEKQEKLIELPIEKEYVRILSYCQTLFKQTRETQKFSTLVAKQTLYPFIRKALQYPILVLSLPKRSKSDEYLYHHAVSVSVLVALIAKKTGFNEKQMLEVSLAALLHNIGMVNIPENVLNKPLALTSEEFQLIQQHPTFGYQLLKKQNGLSNDVLLAVLQHHEREDGSGYPYGFQADKIHEYAKMIAIADMYFAMCAQRPYKKAMSPFTVVETLKTDSFGRLNPALVHHFIELVSASLSVGKRVRLNNGQIGEIVYIDKNALTRPTVNVAGRIVDLQKAKSLSIDEVL